MLFPNKLALVQYVLLFCNLLFTSCRGLDSKWAYLYNGTANDVQNQECTDIFNNIPLNGSLPLWALKMLDSTGKLQAGIISGNIMSLGDYDECITINDRSAGVKGKYCIVAYKISEEAPLLYGLCIPEVCNLAAMIPSREHNFYLRDDLCQTDDLTFDGADISCIIFITFSVLLVATSTIYDLYKRHLEQYDRHPILLAFSIYSNSLKLFKINPSAVSSLYGIRVFCLMCIMYVHRVSIMMEIPAMNMLELEELKYRDNSKYIYAANFAVDTFCFLSGFIVAYKTLKTGHRLKLCQVPHFVIHRWLRIIPTVAVLYLFILTLSRRVGSGPFYQLGVENARVPCIQHWWSYFLFIQNYVNEEDLCLSQIWYLSMDMQMYLLSPVILLPLGKLFYAGKIWTIRIILFLLIILSMIIPMLMTMNEDKLNTYATHWRLAIFITGICGGMKAVNMETAILKLNPKIYLFVWIFVLVTMVILATPAHFLIQESNSTFPITLSTFGRPLWGVCLTWIILNCMSGQCALVNKCLSLPLFQVTSRLMFCMYAIHHLEIDYHAISTRNSIYFSDFLLVQAWISDVVITIFFAYIWSMLFEAPVIQLEKIIFGATRSPSPKIKSTTQKIGLENIII